MNDEYLYLWAQWGILNFERYKYILQEFGDLETAWKTITPDFLHKTGMNLKKVDRVFEIRKRISFYDTMSIIKSNNIDLICYEDDNYPSLLRNIYNPPPFLFVRGTLPLFQKSIGIVGTRGVTEYGNRVTDIITSDLVKNKFVIVSGLALGVDARAHNITLSKGGIAVAVLGSGVDKIYPKANYELAMSIINSGGAVISEYPLGTPPLPYHFPQRNRIISGLSQGVVVTEGDIKSGALITAKLALEQGREVFAIPNDITKVGLSGTNHLIRRSEAKLIENINHVLEEF